ncbi:hypothetical protein FA15DRAFT_663916 [Coprinopsis marcescibilis]|uniref:Large ribosomal subunit protein uL23m n=1 Tax=Coprinopsis marcescibilis TaxID=230819 RepID=A0A5C3LAE2_COPMA|nr:hypothetical protein FA15DRAFT_663916 [Coprinopsis marcescibilis]
MQALGLRRLPSSVRHYATLPHGALAARTASTPLAVRERRSKKSGITVAPGETDANPTGLTPTEVARYTRLKALGQLPQVNGKVISPSQWSRQVNVRRSRIRGFQKATTESGREVVKAVGQRVYLPNIIFKLVRNHTLEGEPYNPYEATFRIPKSITKTDIRSYLDAVYGVKTTYIRTDNYYTPTPPHGRQEKTHKSYKRAVVGLSEPFYYPHRLEDMPTEAKQKREQWIEQEFAIKKIEQDRREEILRKTLGHGSAAFRFRPENATKRSHILRLVTDRKLAREQLVSKYAKDIQEKRAEGADVDYQLLAKSSTKIEAPKDSSSS